MSERNYKKKWIGVCDPDETYALKLVDYLSEKKIFPYEILAFTNMGPVYDYALTQKAELLLVSESLWETDTFNTAAEQSILLCDGGPEDNQNTASVNKYQSCSQIVKDILKHLPEEKLSLPSAVKGNNRLTIIGNYSPVKRCLQTSFSLCMGQLLARRHKTLYLNFESFSGFEGLFSKKFHSDLTDLLYYFACDKSKLPYRLESIRETVNGLDYIPPTLNGEELSMIQGSQWKALFNEIGRSTEYEYLILDLNESMGGLFEVMSHCTLIYTITKEDARAASKLSHYESVLRENGYEEICSKTRKKQLPIFRQLDDSPELLTHGQLADCVRSIIEDDLNEYF